MVSFILDSLVGEIAAIEKSQTQQIGIAIKKLGSQVGKLYLYI